MTTDDAFLLAVVAAMTTFALTLFSVTWYTNAKEGRDKPSGREG